LRKNCLSEHIFEEDVKVGIDIEGRRGKICKQLLDDLHEWSGVCAEYNLNISV
jgi:hypothetical protein